MGSAFVVLAVISLAIIAQDDLRAEEKLTPARRTVQRVLTGRSCGRTSTVRISASNR